MIVDVPSQRIPLDRANIGPMLFRVARTGGWLLHVETNSHGETIAYLVRKPAPAAA